MGELPGQASCKMRLNSVADSGQFPAVNLMVGINTSQCMPSASSRNGSTTAAADQVDYTTSARVEQKSFGHKRNHNNEPHPFPPHDFEPLVHSRAGRRYPPGLGLSVAHDRIVAHDGRLDIEGAPGQGSRFTLYIPRDTQPAAGE